MSVLALVLEVHLHLGAIVRLRFRLVIELKLGAFAADLPLLLSSGLCYLREHDTTRTSTLLA